MSQPLTDVTGRNASQAKRLESAELFARRQDTLMGILGVIFLFVILGQLLVTEPVTALVFSIIGWIFWAIFVAEFLLRAYIAGFSKQFWKKNWWQIIFLLVPFLRFFRALQSLRLLRMLRLSRVGGIVSAGVRSTRSAGRLLSSRIGWLLAVTIVVILTSSQLLYVVGAYDSYTDAIFEAAMTTITGVGMTPTDTFSRILQVLLAAYSVAIFATLAGSLGAFFLRKEQTDPMLTNLPTTYKPGAETPGTEYAPTTHTGQQ